MSLGIKETATVAETQAKSAGDVDSAPARGRIKRTSKISPTVKPVDVPPMASTVSSGVLNTVDVAGLKPGVYHFADVLDLENLVENNYRRVDETSREYLQLSNSIALAGVREPVHLFVDNSPEGGGKIKIIAGHHRTHVVRALREVGNNTALPAILDVPVENEDKAAVIARSVTATVTNVVRKKLKGIERARAIQELLKRGMKPHQVTMVIGVNKKVVERSKNLLILPDEAQAYISENLDSIRENRLFEIAQEYKKKVQPYVEYDDEGSIRVLDPDGKAAADHDLQGLLEAEVKGEGPAAKSSQKKRTSNHLSIPEGHILLEIEDFRARLKIAKLPAKTVEMIEDALQASTYREEVIDSQE